MQQEIIAHGRVLGKTWGKATESSQTMSINPHAHSRYSWKGKKFLQKSHICSILLSASLQVPCPYPFAICLHGSQSKDTEKKQAAHLCWSEEYRSGLNICSPAKYQCTWLVCFHSLCPARFHFPSKCPPPLVPVDAFHVLFTALSRPVLIVFQSSRSASFVEAASDTKLKLVAVLTALARRFGNFCRNCSESWKI